MTVSVALLGTPATQTATATVYTTASITPPANRTVIAAIANTAGSANLRAPTSVSGWGVQWNLINNITLSQLSDRNLSLWACWTGPSPTAGVLTVTYPLAQTTFAYHTLEVTGNDPVPARHTLATPTIQVAANASITVPGPLTGDAIVAWLALDGNGAVTSDPNYTQLANHSSGTALRVASQSRADITDPVANWTSPSNLWLAGAVEIPAAGTTPFTVTGLGRPDFTAVTHTTFTTPSITPTANRVLLLAVANASSINTVPSSVTGLGLTWTQVANRAYSTNSYLSCWWAYSGASPAAGTITVNWPANQTGSAWQLFEIAGLDPSVPFGTPVTGSGSSGSAGTPINVTLPGAVPSTNGVLSILAAAVNPAIPEAGLYTPVFHRWMGSSVQVNGAWRMGSGDTTVDWSFTTGSQPWAQIAVEMRAAPSIVTGAATITGTGTVTASGIATHPEVVGAATIHGHSTVSVAGVAEAPHQRKAYMVWDAELVTDDADLVNWAALANQAEPPLEAEARDLQSIALYGPHTLPQTRTEDLWSTVDQGQRLAEYYVDAGAQPRMRVDSFTLHLLDPNQDLWEVAIDRRRGDVVEFLHEQPTTTGPQALDLFSIVAGIRHEITPDHWITTIACTRTIGNRATHYWDVTPYSWDEDAPDNVWAH